MESTDTLLDAKRGLLKELSAKLAAAGSSQEVIAERLGIARPDVSAIHAGNTKRFTFERIVRMLQRLGSEINIDVVPRGRGGRVRGVSLEDLGLLSLIPWLHHNPGLTLIGGAPDHGQRELLTAILGEHARRGERTVLFTQGVWGSGLPVVPFRTDDDLMKWVVYNEDIDLPQRERFGSAIVVIDCVSRHAASPWTALHFAKSARTYALITSPVGANEGQRTVDEFVRLLGPQHLRRSWRDAHPALDAVIVPRVRSTARGNASVLLVSTFGVDPDADVVRTVSDARTQEAALISTGVLSERPSNAFWGPLLTEKEAKGFLGAVRDRLGDRFQVTGPHPESKKEFELDIVHRATAASVTVAASWSAVNRRYSVVLTTEEPDGVVGDRIPETSLSLVPTDVEFVVSRAIKFLSSFDCRAETVR